MLKRVSICLVVCLLFFTIVGCGNSTEDVMEKIGPDTQYMKPERGTPVENYSVSFDIIGGKDVMPIGAWWSPYDNGGKSINGEQLPNYFDDYYFQLAKDSGLNVFTVSPNKYEDNPAEAELMLEQCEKFDMGFFVHDTRISNTDDQSIAKIGERVQDYYKYDSCLGVHMADEPLANRFDGIGKIYKAYDELNINDKYLYTNMLPTDYPNSYSGNAAPMNYEEYLRTYLEKVSTKFLSYDHYPFKQQNDGITKSSYFNNLSIVRKLANEYKIPFWVFVQAGGQHEEYEIETKPVFPNEAELLWNVNTCLAYGAKSIQYFTFLQPLQFTYAPNGARDYTRNGMIGAMGNINQWYYYVQKANKQVAAVDHVLMNSASMGIIKGGEVADACILGDEVIESGSFRELQKVVADDYIIGCFDYYGGTALYVVNNSVIEKNDIELHFSDKYGYDIIQRGNKYSVAAKTVKLTLEKGEGVLVTLKYE